MLTCGAPQHCRPCHEVPSLGILSKLSQAFGEDDVPKLQLEEGRVMTSEVGLDEAVGLSEASSGLERIRTDRPVTARLL